MKQNIPSTRLRSLAYNSDNNNNNNKCMNLKHRRILEGNKVYIACIGYKTYMKYVNLYYIQILFINLRPSSAPDFIFNFIF